MSQQKQTSVKSEQAKQAYEAPQMQELGSVQEMTQTIQGKGGSHCVILYT